MASPILAGVLALAFMSRPLPRVQPMQPGVARPLLHSVRAPAPTMGVPRFFRWITERFPQINKRISEGRRSTDYVDNFYLDMNGIIHTCTHGDGIKPGEQPSEEQMIEKIFEYTDRLISIARPRKVLYLAIDGVAPRAKMNQQRSRRYRAPRELDTAQVVAGVHHGLHGPVRALNLAHRAPQHALAASPVAGERVEEPDGALDAAARAKPRREQADQHEREGEGPVRRGQDSERGGDHGGGRYRVRGRENRDPRAGTGARRARGRLCVGTKWARANSPPVRFRDESCAESCS